MIEIYYKNNVTKYKSVDEIDYLPDQHFLVSVSLVSNQFRFRGNFKKFKLDLSSFSKKKEDIEISLHYIESC
jgi:hypothetical protein